MRLLWNVIVCLSVPRSVLLLGPKLPVVLRSSEGGVLLSRCFKPRDGGFMIQTGSYY